MVDVTGLELDEARARLATAGVIVRAVTETVPPHAEALSGPYRVVRVRGDGAAVDLVVTRERYGPRGG